VLGGARIDGGVGLVVAAIKEELDSCHEGARNPEGGIS